MIHSGNRMDWSLAHTIWPQTMEEKTHTTYAHVLRLFWMKKSQPLNLTDEMHSVFNERHVLMEAGAPSANLDHNKCFNVSTASLDYQMGTCMMQMLHPSPTTEKLHIVQRNYITTEQEKLSKLVTDKVFLSIPLGANIPLLTNHKIWEWWLQDPTDIALALDEFLSRLHLTVDLWNILANNLSRLPHLSTSSYITEGKKW